MRDSWILILAVLVVFGAAMFAMGFLAAWEWNNLFEELC